VPCCGAASPGARLCLWKPPGYPHLEAHCCAAARTHARPFPTRAAGLRGQPAGRRAGSPLPRAEQTWTMPRARRSTTPRCWDCLPGGAALARLAGRAQRALRISRPMPRPARSNQFQCLKTAAPVALRAARLDDQVRADVARAFQDAVVDTLARNAPARRPPHRASWCRGSRQPAAARRLARSRWAARGTVFRAPNLTDKRRDDCAADAALRAPRAQTRGWALVLARAHWALDEAYLKGLKLTNGQDFISCDQDRAIHRDLRWERRSSQTVLIDLELAVDVRKAALSDAIADTVN